MTHPPQQAIYGDNPRVEVGAYLPPGIGSVLDVGCGAGGFGATLRERLGPAARIVGVEAVASQAARARAAGTFDAVIDGYFPDALHGCADRFDLICFNDVLEHIVDPWSTLDQCRAVLAPGGRVIAAIPNVQYAPVVWGLVRGRFAYADDGVLDRTHVRFFTPSSARDLFESTGYRIERFGRVNSIARVWNTDPIAPRRWAKGILARALGDAAFLHVVVVARPEPMSESAA